jgi:hypothetical protein
MKIFYRISEGGYNKKKLEFAYNKLNVFKKFCEIFKEHDIYVVADNVKQETYDVISQHICIDRIFRTTLGYSRSFMFALKYSLSNFDINDIIYFAEDDYIYTDNADKIILEGFLVGDYVSGYDHPDKYINHSDGGPNPYIENGGETTRVMLTKNRHWKLTNSCCMTFAVKLKTIKEDLKTIEKYCGGDHLFDFQLFIELNHINKRNIVSCIPGVSTHAEIEWLSPLIDWEKEFYKN